MKKNKTSLLNGLGALSLHKSKEKENGLNNTRKLTETCKENLKLELKLIKRCS